MTYPALETRRNWVLAVQARPNPSGHLHDTLVDEMRDEQVLSSPRIRDARRVYSSQGGSGGRIVRLNSHMYLFDNL